MSDWSTKSLGEIAENISRPFDFRGKSKVIFVNTGDVLEGKFLHSDYSDVDGLPGQAKKGIKKGDILYSEIRPGNKRYVYVDFDAEDYVVSTKFMVIKPRSNEVSSEYLYMLLTSKVCEEEFKIIADSRSGTFPQITFDSIAYYPIRYPESNEQERSFNIANSLLNKIELNRQTNQTLEQIAQAIFKSWFVDFEPTRAKMIITQKYNALSPRERAGVRVEQAQALAAQAIICGAVTLEDLATFQLDSPPINAHLLGRIHAKLDAQTSDELGDNWLPESLAATAALFPNALVDSELGEIPEGWKSCELKDIAEFSTERINTEELTIKNYISTENMLEGKSGVTLASSLPTSKTVPSFKAGHVLISNIRPYFKKIWFSRFDGGRSGDVLGLVSKNKNGSPFLYNLLYQDEFFSFMMLTSKGAKMPRGDKDAIMGWDCVMPPEDVVDQFSDLVSVFYKKIDKNNIENLNLQELRNTLLPKLLSGALSVAHTNTHSEAL